MGVVELPRSTSTQASAAWSYQALREIAVHVEDFKGGDRKLNNLLVSNFKDNEKEAANAERLG